MGQVLVRNLGDDVVARLKLKASNAHVSLEQYLRDLLTREAMATKAEALEVLRAVREDSTLVDFDFTGAIREDRER